MSSVIGILLIAGALCINSWWRQKQTTRRVMTALLWHGGQDRYILLNELHVRRSRLDSLMHDWQHQGLVKELRKGSSRYYRLEPQGVLRFHQELGVYSIETCAGAEDVIINAIRQRPTTCYSPDQMHEVTQLPRALCLHTLQTLRYKGLLFQVKEGGVFYVATQEFREVYCTSSGTVPA